MFRSLSLQVKLSLLFTGLLLTVSLVDILSVTRSSQRYLDEVMQRANLGLAASIAKEMRIDTVTDQVSAVRMNELFMAAMTINPTIKMFIVGLDGRLVASSATPEATKLSAISLDRIYDLLDARQPLPVYNDDPRDPTDPKIFSVAPLTRPNGTPVA